MIPVDVYPIRLLDFTGVKLPQQIYVVMKFVKGCSLLSIAIFRPNDKQMKMQQSNYTTWNLFKKSFEEK